MDTMKTALAAAVVLAVGALAGAAYDQYRMKPQLADLQLQRERSEMEAVELREKTEALGQHSRQLEAQNAALRDQVDALRGQIDSLRQASSPQPATPSVPEPAEVQAADLESLLASGETDPSATDDGRRRGRRDRPNEGDSERSEEWRQRRNEFVNQVRERTQDFMTQEMAKTSDPAVRQRLQTITENADYMMEVMQQLREAPEGAERDALQQEFDQVRETMRTLVRDQQDYALRQVAADHGITDPAQQQSFVDSLRETESSPIFRAPILTWGGPSGFRRGGPEATPQP